MNKSILKELAFIVKVAETIKFGVVNISRRVVRIRGIAWVNK